MTEEILQRYKQKIKELTLVPGDGGCFEVFVNGDLVYSKLKTGVFPEHKNIIKTIETRL